MVGKKKDLIMIFSPSVFVWLSPFLNNLDQMIARATMEGGVRKKEGVEKNPLVIDRLTHNDQTISDDW